jgi:hypothetical protein
VTSPGILTGPLLAGEGPHSLAADTWQAGRLCGYCDRDTAEPVRPDYDGWIHPSCAGDSSPRHRRPMVR